VEENPLLKYYFSFQPLTNTCMHIITTSHRGALGNYIYVCVEAECGGNNVYKRRRVALLAAVFFGLAATKHFYLKV
jgi:hypothetical protein